MSYWYFILTVSYISVFMVGWSAHGLYLHFKGKKTCDGCKFKPNQDENYYASCQSCSRFYSDEYTK